MNLLRVPRNMSNHSGQSNFSLAKRKKLSVEANLGCDYSNLSHYESTVLDIFHTLIHSLVL